MAEKTVKSPFTSITAPFIYSSPFLEDYTYGDDDTEYDTSRLINADDFGKPWKSDLPAHLSYRYSPTTYGQQYGKDNDHYNYVLNIEGKPEYINFGKALFDSSGNLTSVGKAWIEAVDALLPENSPSRFNQGSWQPYTNVHGIQTQQYTDLAKYINHMRNDLVLGARHNIFSRKGKRYYIMENGQKRYVRKPNNPYYTILNTPTQVQDGDIIWDDYEITKSKINVSPGETETSTGQAPDGAEVPAERGGKKSFGFDWSKIGEGLLNLINNPGIYASGRLLGNLINNERVYGEYLKGIRPDLKLTYYTGRQVVGDEATKQGYYRRAAQGQTKAARPFTSDADRQIAYQNEAKRIGDELRALGDLADNLEIRRTSDESNQHQWANTQRNTEIANYNIESINKANALKHNVLALKHSAQWSSIDNFLKGIEYRKRQLLAELLAIDDLIFTLELLQELLDDTRIKEALEALNKVISANTKDGVTDWTTVKESQEAKNLLIIKMLILREQLEKKRDYYKTRNLAYYSKLGSKIKTTKKRKEDLLYKSTRDVVEHFRKMSKLSSDALDRKHPKIEKLTSHPKASKYQYGGVAPFTVYTPVALGGETSTTTESSSSTGGRGTSSSSKKDDQAKDTLDFVKSLFKEMLGKGLPVDVNHIYKQMTNLFQRSQLLGEDLDTNDLALMYLLSMQQLNGVMHSKEIFDKAKAEVTKNEALGEFAVTADGQYVVLDKDGKIDFASLKEIKEKKLNPITNLQLLYLRSQSPDLLLLKGDFVIENIVNNGIGLRKIADQIKEMAGSLGSSDEKLEGITKVESDKVKAGLKALAEAPDGYYQVTDRTKESSDQVEAALAYIEKMLTPSLKAILDIHSDGNSKALIATFLSSQMTNIRELTITPLTGKAAKDAETKSEEIKSNPLMQMIQGQGGIPRTLEIITKDSTARMSTLGVAYSSIPKVDGDMSIDLMLEKSGLAGMLDSKLGITFGDLHVNPDQLKDIMFADEGNNMVVTLPCKIVKGRKEVNLGVRKSYEEAVESVESKGISKSSPEYNKALGLALKEKGLDSLLDSEGYPDRNKFAQFLVVQGYATSKVKGLDTSSEYIKKVKDPDSKLEERLEKALSTNDKKDNYSLDIDYWLWGDDVYRGTVFIPLSNNLNSAINAWGNQIDIDESRELERKYLNFNKASTAKSSNSSVLKK